MTLRLSFPFVFCNSFFPTGTSLTDPTLSLLLVTVILYYWLLDTIIAVGFIIAVGRYALELVNTQPTSRCKKEETKVTTQQQH